MTVNLHICTMLADPSLLEHIKYERRQKSLTKVRCPAPHDGSSVQKHLKNDFTMNEKHHMSQVKGNLAFAYAKTNAQISCAVTVHLISALVFTTR